MLTDLVFVYYNWEQVKKRKISERKQSGKENIILVFILLVLFVCKGLIEIYIIHESVFDDFHWNMYWIEKIK